MDLISTYKNNNSSHILLSKNKDENYRKNQSKNN